MFKSKIVQIRKCSNLNLFNFKIVQIKKCSKFEIRSIFVNALISKNLFKFEKRKNKIKQKQKPEKLRKTGPETKKPVKQVKTRPEYTRRFLKPDSEKNAYWAGPKRSNSGRQVENRHHRRRLGFTCGQGKISSPLLSEI
jgi:hypothetical protein